MTVCGKRRLARWQIKRFLKFNVIRDGGYSIFSKIHRLSVRSLCSPFVKCLPHLFFSGKSSLRIEPNPIYFPNVRPSKMHPQITVVYRILKPNLLLNKRIVILLRTSLHETNDTQCFIHCEDRNQTKGRVGNLCLSFDSIVLEAIIVVTTPLQ